MPHQRPQRCRRRLTIALLAAAGLSPGSAASAFYISSAHAVISPFGVAADGRSVSLVTLVNRAGMIARISTRGGAIVELDVPDRWGKVADVVLGRPSFSAWEMPGPPFNAIVGRYANRISGGGFTIDGHFYALAGADPRTGIVSHGGPGGFHQKLWRAHLLHNGANGVELFYSSPAGENGFPGTLDVRVTYTLTDDNVLTVSYRATTTAPTVLNLTNHSYFNLGGQTAGPIYGEDMQVLAGHYTPTDAHQVPTGEVRSVVGTPFDFRAPARIGDRIYSSDPQILAAHGLDENFVLDKAADGAISLAARLHDSVTGRILEIRTTEPGMQIYSANFFNGSEAGSAGRALRQGDGVAFETQHFPDSPNHAAFPSTLLRPGEVFRSITQFRFATDTERAEASYRTGKEEK